MKKLFVVFILFIVSGCTMTSTTGETGEVSVGLSRRFVSLRQVYTGMTRKEVQSVLPKQVIIGYEMSDSRGGQFRPITIDNPHRMETYQKGFKSYAIDYYLVGIKTADNQVTEDELVPLVFHNNKLVGTGWDYLRENVKK